MGESDIRGATDFAVGQFPQNIAHHGLVGRHHVFRRGGETREQATNTTFAKVPFPPTAEFANDADQLGRSVKKRNVLAGAPKQRQATNVKFRSGVLVFFSPAVDDMPAPQKSCDVRIISSPSNGGGISTTAHGTVQIAPQ